ncbi:hypothetical protein CEP54_002901 [Fusarium duplospermum]|uniref:DUF4470 domain-containing protein n=1 Tax=Fusarium duplospermum TaxID=1325734 RepID=A0A428QT02_9HYPO|nr:hypothetical protein CEP54_002901 [Fusarium duplospermum]
MHECWSDFERREPTFRRQGYVAPFARRKNVWGDVPAFDILELAENEGATYDEDLAILFAGKYSPNPLCYFRKHLAITINDNDFEVVARNIILLLTAMFSAKPEDAANRMIHIWYSAFIEQSHLQFLHSVVRPKIDKVCRKLESEDFNHLHSEIFADGLCSRVNIVLPKHSWFALLEYLKVPEGLSLDQARQVRTAATFPVPDHLDYLEHNYYPLLPAQRIC